MKTLRLVPNTEVAHTHQIGRGYPDVTVGTQGLTLIGNFRKEEVLELIKSVKNCKVLEGANLLIEIKDGSLTPSKRKLTEDEENWHSKWKGQVAIVSSEKEALELMGLTSED